MFLVVTIDHTLDPAFNLIADKDKAIEKAKENAIATCRRPEYYEEEEPGSWIFHVGCGESDYVYVQEIKIED